MSSVNKVILVGNLGKDPVIRTTQAGKKIANFSMAMTKKWRDRDGNRKEKTTWMNVVVFNDGLAGVVGQYARKGSKLYVEGEISVRKYTGDDNVERWATEVVVPDFGGSIVLCDRKEGGGPGQAPPVDSYDETATASPPPPSDSPPPSDYNDEVPF